MLDVLNLATKSRLSVSYFIFSDKPTTTHVSVWLIIKKPINLNRKAYRLKNLVLMQKYANA